MTEGEYRARWAALGRKPVFHPDRNVKWNERRWIIHRQRKGGMSFEEIAKAHKISVSGARRVYSNAVFYIDELKEREARKMRGD